MIHILSSEAPYKAIGKVLQHAISHSTVNYCRFSIKRNHKMLLESPPHIHEQPKRCLSMDALLTGVEGIAIPSSPVHHFFVNMVKMCILWTYALSPMTAGPIFNLATISMTSHRRNAKASRALPWRIAAKRYELRCTVA
jgi:hypothetical protein